MKFRMTGISCAVCGALFVNGVHPQTECKRTELCEVKPAEAPHSEQERHDPAPPTNSRLTVFATSTSSEGQYAFLRNGGAAPFFKRST
jgi:hypothetical protein